MKKFITLFAAILFTTTNFIFAQTQNIDTSKTAPNVIEYDDDFDLFDLNLDFGTNPEMNKLIKHASYTKYSTINLNFGPSNLHYDVDGFNVGLLANSNKTIELGTTRFSATSKSSVFKYKFSGLSVSRVSEDLLGEKDDAQKLRINLWNVGLIGHTGFGYDLGSGSKLVLYNGGLLNWSFISYDKPDNLNPVEKKELDYIGTSIRFGERSQNGIKYFLTENIAVNFEQERTAVYTRHLFWYWAASSMVYGMGTNLIDGFTKSILKNSPQAAPIVNFLLKGAYSYGYYELKKKNMYWPFSTNESMMFDAYKIGLSFNL